VKGQIDAAKREFARTLPAAPSENQAYSDLFDQVERLRRENDDLRAELTALRAGNPLPATRTRGPINVDEAAPVRGNSPATRRPFIDPLPQTSPPTEEPSPITRAPETPEPDSQVATVQPAPTTPTRSVPTKPTPPSGVRKHTVTKGDTLYRLAVRYYGDRSRWRDIFGANRDVLPSAETPLRIGMDLKIP